MNARLNHSTEIRVGGLAILREVVSDKPSVRLTVGNGGGNRAGSNTAVLRIVSVAANTLVE